jgi:hypothetical protein
MEKVIPKSSRHGFVTVEIINGDDDKGKVFSFRDPRCGLHWPSAGSPGFYVLIAESIKENITGGCSLQLLREGEDQIPSKLYEKMANDMGAFSVKDIYTDTSEQFKGYVLDFIKFKREERPRQPIYLRLAPFYQDFSHGVFTIREWVKKDALVIPKESVIYDQLKNITSQDLRGNPEEKFFAVDALRFAVGAFKIFGLGSLEGPRDKPRGSVAPPVGAFS